MTKRANDEGSVFLNQSKGLWEAKITIDGKRISRYAKTQQLALGKLADLNKEKNLGIAITSNMKLNQFLPEWLEVHKNTIREKSYDDYKGVMKNHILPRLGNYSLHKLTPEVITRAWSTMIREGYSPTLTKHCQARLSVALTTAVKRNILSRNPCQYATVPKAQQKEINILDEKDYQEILEFTGINYPQYYGIVFIALQTAMRRGELCALQWRDIDLDLANIYVNRSVFEKGSVSHYQPPKTRSGQREIALVPEAVIFLRDLKEAMKTSADKYGYDFSEHSHVFRYSHNGGNIKTHTITKAFKKIVQLIAMSKVNTTDLSAAETKIAKAAAAKATKIHFHDLRHTHAGIMLKMGVHPKVVQERIGHSSISITMDIYSHITPNMQREAIKGFTLFNQPV